MTSLLQPTKCCLIFLPEEILLFLANYLIPTEDQNKKVFSFSQDWRNFMNTSKEYFGEGKIQSQVISLQWIYADRFLRSSKFRERILSTINDSEKQIDLVFTASKYEPPNPENIKLHLKESYAPVRKIILNDKAFVSCSVKCSELYVRHGHRFEHYILHSSLVFIDAGNSYFDHISAEHFLVCSSLHTLSLHCRYLHDYRKLKRVKLKDCKSITDVSCFRNVQSLSLISCPNLEFDTTLQNLDDLEVRDCNSIEDISVFRNIHRLKIEVYRVTDVSVLQNVHYLDLGYCFNIVDVSALGNVHSLILNDCELVLDLSALNNVYSLEYHNFHGSDVSGLKNVVHLDLFNSQNISNISMLKTVVFLNIHSCPKIASLSGLNNLKELVCNFATPFITELVMLQLRKTVLYSGSDLANLSGRC
jgi:hypothetical protein